jgi:hypothetical protein
MNKHISTAQPELFRNERFVWKGCPLLPIGTFQSVNFVPFTSFFIFSPVPGSSQFNSNHVNDKQPFKLLHLLFGVLRIFGTLMEWNRRESEQKRVGAVRTDTWHCLFPRDCKWRRQILCIQCTLHCSAFAVYPMHTALQCKTGKKCRTKNMSRRGLANARVWREIL